ncbi:MAG: phosphoadenosine phosphosulfate reductase family protein [bacterium]
MISKQKVKEAQKIIRQARSKWDDDKIAVAWTGGKDSTVILSLIRETFNGKIPFRVIFNDSTIEFPEVYEFIKKTTKDWNLKLITIPHLPEDLQAYQDAVSPEDKMEIMRIAKINAINYAITEYKLQAFMSGIRADEHESRSEETHFSPRTSHMRVHPILNFTLTDIWDYIKEFEVPYVKLYDQGYKSLGEAPFTSPVSDPNAPERAGREATKEKTMKRLRDLGYW